jgi:hypothetical protein
MQIKNLEKSLAPIFTIVKRTLAVSPNKVAHNFTIMLSSFMMARLLTIVSLK